MESSNLIEFYTPLNCENRTAKIGFVDLTDNWSQQALINLRAKQNLQALFGLQTDSKNISKPIAIDGVITCASADNHLVMNIFAANLKPDTLAEDVNELIKAYQNKGPARFIQVQGNSTTDEGQKIREITSQLLRQIPDNEFIEFMMLNVVSEPLLSLSQFNDLIDMIQDRTVEDFGFFYQNDVVEEVASDWMGAILIAN